MFPSIVQGAFYLLYLSHSDYQRCWKVRLSNQVVLFSSCSFLKYWSFGEHVPVCTDVIKYTLSVLRSSGAEWQGCTSVFPGNARNEAPGPYPAMALSSAWGQPIHRAPPQLLRALAAPVLCAACCPHGTSMCSTMLSIAGWGFWLSATPFYMGKRLETTDPSFHFWHAVLWVISFQWWL